jgi:hypothetical protein
MEMPRKNQRTLLPGLLLLLLACAGAPAARAQSETPAPAKLIRQIARLDSQVRRCIRSDYEGDVAGFAKSVKVQLVDLNGDGKAELLVPLNDCSNGANGPLFVYRQTSRAYVLLLEATGQEMTPQQAVTNGYRDLEVVGHTSASEQAVDVYKFIRGRYRRVKTFQRTHPTG